MTPRAALLLCLAVFLSISTFQFADAPQDYANAVSAYDARNYDVACRALKTLSDETEGFKRLPADIAAAEKKHGFEWLQVGKQAIAADQANRRAESCAHYYRAGLMAAGTQDWMIAGNDVEYGGREYAEVMKESAPRAAAPAQPRSRKSGAPARRPAATPSQPAQPQQQSSQMQAGSGLIPNGTYKCFTATTGRILAGGGGVVVPGSLVGSIVINGDQYQVNDKSWGRYSVGANGKITWNGGEYSTVTLGRYVIQNGGPVIVIGYADTDAGSACEKR